MSKYPYVRKTIRWKGRRYEVRGQSEAEAFEKLSELMSALRDGREIRSGDTLLEIWYQEWKRVYKESTDLTTKSLRLYDEKYQKYIGPVIGTMKLRDVHDIHLQSILNDQRGMSFSHVTKLRMVMQEIFRQAYRSRLIPFDPSAGLRLPKNSKRSHRSITEEERAHILEVAAYHPSGLWVLLILYSGLRPGEAAALQWKDIDFDRNEIHVYKAIESGTNHIKTPKTAAGIRDIPMRKDLRQLLWQARGDPFSSRRRKEPSAAPPACGGYGILSPKNWTFTWEQKHKMEKLFTMRSHRTLPFIACDILSVQICKEEA